MSVNVLEDITNDNRQKRDQTQSLSEGPAVIWDFDPNLTNEIYEDLGVGELEESETPKGTQKQKTKAKVADKRKQTQLKPDPNLTTPSPSAIRVPAQSHIHNGTKCSCTRRRILNSEEEGIDYFSCLPDEVILSIFRWFQKKTLIHCAKVCKRWRWLAYDDNLWRRVDLSSHTFQPGILGQVLQRGVVHTKLSRSTINTPVFDLDAEESMVVDDEDDQGRLSPSSSDQLQLESLDLSGCIVDDPACIESILSRTTSLRHLSLESCHLQGGALASLAPRLASLQVLDIAMCRLTTTEGLPHLLTETQQLKSLNMSWINLGRPHLTEIIANLAPCLRHLNIGGYREKLRDGDVSTLVKRCPHLEELDLSDCTVITQASISAVTENLRNLQHISLSRCYDIPFYSFLSLETIPTLRALDVFGVMQPRQVERLKAQVAKISINSFAFSSIARPTCSAKQPRHIWGEYCNM